MLDNPISLSLLVLACTLAAAAAGFALRRRLGPAPDADQSREGVRMAMSLMTTLTAIVLGMVTASAKETYDQATAVVTGTAVDMITLDRKLDNYGPEAAAARAEVRVCVDRMIERMQSGERYFVDNKHATEVGTSIERVWSAIHVLKPADARQEDLRDQALAILSGRVKYGPGNLEQQQWAFAVKPASVPRNFLIVVVAWLVLEFFALGIFFPRSRAMSVAITIAGLVVASSMFLILELEDPLTGAMRVPVESLKLARDLLGR